MDTNKQCQVAQRQTVYTVLSSFFWIDFEWYKIFSTIGYLRDRGSTCTLLEYPADCCILACSVLWDLIEAFNSQDKIILLYKSRFLTFLLKGLSYY
jgi:hypothetical protein